MKSCAVRRPSPISVRSDPSAAIPGLRPHWIETLGRHWRGEGASHWLTRFLILRLLGVVYFVAYLVLAQQIVPLVGSRGLTPIATFHAQASAYFGSSAEAVLRYPSLFWIAHSDGLLIGCAWLGVLLSALVALGYANAIVMTLLWALYLSFVHIGQLWYSFGWEIQLCETGFLAIFLCPLLDNRPFPHRTPPTTVI